MNLDDWTESTSDPQRRRRLLLGYVVGIFVVAATGAFIVLTSNKAAAVEEEDPAIEAQLAKEPEPEPPPEPPPPPPPAQEAAKPPPPKPKIKAPTEVPDQPLKEAEADKSQLTAQEDPFQRDQPAPEPTPEPAVVTPPPPPPAPKPVAPVEKKGPIRVTEDVTPPVARGGNARPEYPASAKAAGIEGVVVIKYVVSEKGDVTEAKVVKGPPELAEACLAAVRSWRFEPALLEGKPVAVIRQARFPFTIKT